MLLTEHMDLAKRHVRHLKERACRRGPKDILPSVASYRGEELIALATLGGQDFRTDLLTTARICAFGFDADVIAASFETVQSCQWDEENPESAGINPATMHPWRSGEIQDVLTNHDGAAKGWVTEALTALVVNRAGDVRQASMPFGYAGKDQILYWREEMTPIISGGAIPQLLTEAMLSISSGAWFPEDMTDFGRDERDIETARALNAFVEKIAVILMAYDDDSPERVRKLMNAGTPWDMRKKSF